MERSPRSRNVVAEQGDLDRRQVGRRVCRWLRTGCADRRLGRQLDQRFLKLLRRGLDLARSAEGFARRSCTVSI